MHLLAELETRLYSTAAHRLGLTIVVAASEAEAAMAVAATLETAAAAASKPITLLQSSLCRCCATTAIGQPASATAASAATHPARALALFPSSTLTKLLDTGATAALNTSHFSPPHSGRQRVAHNHPEAVTYRSHSGTAHITPPHRTAAVSASTSTRRA